MGGFGQTINGPIFFGTGLGFAFGPRAGPARPEMSYVGSSIRNKRLWSCLVFEEFLITFLNLYMNLSGF